MFIYIVNIDAESLRRADMQMLRLNDDRDNRVGYFEGKRFSRKYSGTRGCSSESSSRELAGLRTRPMRKAVESTMVESLPPAGQPSAQTCNFVTCRWRHVYVENDTFTSNNLHYFGVEARVRPDWFYVGSISHLRWVKSNHLLYNTRPSYFVMVVSREGSGFCQCLLYFGLSIAVSGASPAGWQSGRLAAGRQAARRICASFSEPTEFNNCQLN